MLTVRHEYAGFYLRRNCRKLCPCTYVCIWVICWLWGMNMQVFTCDGTAENCAPVHMYVYELYADCEAWICRFLPATELQKTVPLYICMYMSYMLTVRHEYAGFYLRRNCRKLCPCTYVCIWVICWLWQHLLLFKGYIYGMLALYNCICYVLDGFVDHLADTCIMI